MSLSRCCCDREHWASGRCDADAAWCSLRTSWAQLSRCTTCSRYRAVHGQSSGRRHVLTTVQSTARSKHPGPGLCWPEATGPAGSTASALGHRSEVLQRVDDSRTTVRAPATHPSPTGQCPSVRPSVRVSAGQPAVRPHGQSALTAVVVAVVIGRAARRVVARCLTTARIKCGLINAGAMCSARGGRPTHAAASSKQWPSGRAFPAGFNLDGALTVCLQRSHRAVSRTNRRRTTTTTPPDTTSTSTTRYEIEYR